MKTGEVRFAASIISNYLTENTGGLTSTYCREMGFSPFNRPSIPPALEI